MKMKKQSKILLILLIVANNFALGTAGQCAEISTSQKNKPISIGLENESLRPTYDLALAKEQALKYPDNPEAHFILGVAYTRISDIENAFKEMHQARKLAAKEGGLSYFDKVICEYENMLTLNPGNNAVRYTIAWAFYMKGYILRQNQAKPNAKTGDKWEKKMALESSDPNYYFQKSQEKLNELVNYDPSDICSKIYNIYLQAVINGNLDTALHSWDEISKLYPNNPAAYFFLGEIYLKKGNIKLSLQNISRAVALRKNNTKND